MEDEYLFSACRDGCYRTVERLLNIPSVNVGARDQISRTPLHVAAREGREDCVRLLIKHGAEVDAFDWNDRTALHNAAAKGHDLVVRRLIIEDASVNLADEEGDTPLHLAAHDNHVTVIRLLLAAGADINAANENSWTATHFAAFNGDMESVKALVEGLPDLSLLDHDGKSAVAVAKDENEEVSIFLATHLQKAKSDSEHGDSEQLSRADEHGRKQRGAMRDLAAQLLATRRQMSERDRLEEMKLDALISERDQIFGELRATKSMLEEKEWEDKQKYSVLTDEKNKMAGELARAKEDRHSLNLLYNQLKLQIEKKEADDASQAQERRNMNSNFTEQMEELKIAHEAVKAEKEWLRSVVDMCNEKVDLLEAELENEQALGHEAVQLLEKAKAEKRTLMKEVEQLQLKLTDATRERKAAEIKVEMLESKGSSANAKKSNLSTTDGHNPDSNEKTPQLGQKRKARKTRMEKISADEDTEMRIGSPPSPTPIRLMAQYNETSSDELKSKMLNDLKAMARERDDAKEMLQNTMNELEQQKVAIDHLNKELKLTKTSNLEAKFGAAQNKPGTTVVQWHLENYCEAKHCDVKFGLLTRRHHCRTCGDSICHNHSVIQKEVMVPQTARVCQDCAT